MTYEANLARVQPRFRGEPFPHEGTGRAVVDGVDEALDIVVHWHRVPQWLERSVVGDYVPWNFNVAGDHPCWRAITNAIV
jgi:hypothetical protein